LRARSKCGRASDHGALSLSHTAEAHVGTRDREAHFRETGWIRVPVYPFHQLKAGETLIGPAIVESPFTSVVVDPGVGFHRTDAGNLALVPAVSEQPPTSERELAQT
jgi:N-methylhydantoinase A